jgi:EAL domain-containing protein (putative c-di-GMP-specific phosphodiesterase class I)
MHPNSQSNSPGGMPTLLVVERQRFPRRALCRLLRAAGADKVVDAVDLQAAARVIAEHETASWIVVADPDAHGTGTEGLRALAALNSTEYATAFLLLCNRRSEGLEQLRNEAKTHGINLLAALRKPVSVEEVGTLFRRMPSNVQRAAGERRHVLTKEELGECLRVGRLKSRFQPKVDLVTGRPTSCEAVPFVTHLHYGDMPPASYAAAMTQLGAQRVMTASVLRDAAKLVRSMRERGLKTTVSVNLAAEVLSEAGDAATLDAYVRTLGITPADLTLEIGEAAAPRTPPHYSENLARLKLRGYVLCMDEVTAAMRLDHPTHTHFAEIKLSRALLSKLGTDAEVSRSVASTVRTAHRFGMVVCAVGVETEAELEHVRDAGIDLGQGTLFADCLPPDEALAWIQGEESARTYKQIAPRRQRVG